MVAEQLKEAVSEMDSYRRDVGSICLKNTNYIVSGGMSWGDMPTEAFDAISMLDFSGIMMGLGSVNMDYESFKC